MNQPHPRPAAVTASMDQIFAEVRESRKNFDTDPYSAAIARVAEFFAADLAAQFPDAWKRKAAGEAIGMAAQFTGAAFTANPDMPVQALMLIFALAAEQVVREAGSRDADGGAA